MALFLWMTSHISAMCTWLTTGCARRELWMTLASWWVFTKEFTPCTRINTLSIDTARQSKDVWRHINECHCCNSTTTTHKYTSSILKAISSPISLSLLLVTFWKGGRVQLFVSPAYRRRVKKYFCPMYGGVKYVYHLPRK